jgi:hypothetical protein
MKNIKARYTAAKSEEAKAHDAAAEANETDDIAVKAHAFADVICAEEKCRVALEDVIDAAKSKR